jgi:predicted Zn-dependent peptidase
MEKIKVTTLENKLRIVSDYIDSVDTISVGIFVGTGSRYETLEQNGISHFLEHMAFKGTKTRSSLEIAESIENVGGYTNAYTSRSSTVYYARVLKENLELAMDILSDIVLNSVFEAKEITREREVILQEIAQNLDSPEDLVYDYLYETVYPNHPLGRNILGSKANVKRFNKDDLDAYIKSNYSNANIVISAAGNVTHDEFLTLAKKYFNLSNSQKVTFNPTTYTHGESLTKKDLEQVQFAEAFQGVGITSADYYAADILASILGGGMSSRLFQEIREKHGLVYSISASSASYADCGLFTISAATGPKELSKFKNLLAQEIDKIMQTPVTDLELSRAKAGYEAALLMSLESMTSRSRFNAYNLLTYNRLISPDEIKQEISSVTREKLLKLAQTIFASGKSTAILGKLST